VLLAGAACIPPLQRPASLPPPYERGDELSDAEAEAHRLVNAHRVHQGLVPLTYDARLAVLAREHSESMAAGRVPFGHDGFEDRSRRIRSFIAYRRVAENVHWNDYPPERSAGIAVSGWLASARHRANIEGTFDVTGIGASRDAEGRTWFTQLFVDER
jgi:uncharacterized protein YkwD